jgi:hypothetical protein
MVDSDRVWNSDIPFIDGENKTVDWTQAGLTGVGILLVSLFESIASVTAALWEAFIIGPATTVGSELGTLMALVEGISGAAMDFGPAEAFAIDTGLIGAMILVAAGGYLIAFVIGVARDG